MANLQLASAGAKKMMASGTKRRGVVVVVGLGEVEEDARRQRERVTVETRLFFSTLLLLRQFAEPSGGIEYFKAAVLLSPTKVIELSSFTRRLVELPSFRCRGGVRLITPAASTSCNVTFRRPPSCGHPSDCHDFYPVENIFRDHICLLIKLDVSNGKQQVHLVYSTKTNIWLDCLCGRGKNKIA